MTRSELEKLFRTPPAEYRPKPFWFWNGEIDRELIRRQLEEMADKGLGGAVICARQGLTVPYLSQAWFDLVEAACGEAERLGLEIWLYDEYPYPSGMAGGIVLMEHPEAAHTVLRHIRLTARGGEKVEAALGGGRVLCALARQSGADGGQELDLTEDSGILQPQRIFQKTGLTSYSGKRFFSYGPEWVLRTCLPAGEWRLDVYMEQPLGDFKYYGGYFDPCCPEAVRTFLETTHEKYRRALGARFGRTVKGMFSDETGLLSPIPWSRRLPEQYRKMYGEDIREALIALHDASRPGACRLRYRFYRAAHECFRESWHHQTAAWCAENGLLYATEVPSMRLGTQRYSTVTGGDTGHEKIGRPLEEIWDTRLRSLRSNARAIASLARQTDRRWAMVESFHSLGWSMTLQDAKWMLDRLGAQGINMNVFHAFYATIQDITKHDAPPSQFLQNPYWTHYRLLADWAGRLSALISRTEADHPVAVLDPASAMWTRLGKAFHRFEYAGEDPGEEADLNGIRDSWVGLCKRLIRAQIGFDHLDAEALAEAEVGGSEIRVGRAVYRAVVLPDCPCMEESALRQLERFGRTGGCLIALGRLPDTAIDGTLTDEETRAAWEGLLQRANAARLRPEDPELIRLLRERAGFAAEVRITGGNAADALSSVRLEEGRVHVFVCNQGGGEVSAEIRLPQRNGRMAVSEWRLGEGTVEAAAVTEAGRGFPAALAPYESRWFSFESAPEAAAAPASASLPEVTVPMEGLWRVKALQPNVYRLTGLSMSLDGERWTDAEEGTFIEQCAAGHLLGGDQIRYASAFGTPKRLQPAYPIHCLYRLRFTLARPGLRASLMMDDGSVSGARVITVNGAEIPEESWKRIRVNDQHNRAADITPWIREGVNELLIRVTVCRDEDGLRDGLYLLGDFGVYPDKKKTGWILDDPPAETVPDAPWPAGFPFFSGTLGFGRSFAPEELSGAEPARLTAFGAILRLAWRHPVRECLEVCVNGVSLGVQAWAPCAWRCPPALLRPDRNEVEVRVTNTLAPMLDGAVFDEAEHRMRPIRPEEG